MSRSMLALLAMASLWTPAVAHHSFPATYDMEKVERIEGTVFQFLFRNPHTMIQVQVADESGETHLWAVEWGAAGQLTREQVSRTTLRPGDRVIIEGPPGRRPEDRKLLLRHIVRPVDGWEWGGTFD